MRVLAVVAKGFAVIRGNDDQGVGAGGLDQPAGSAIDGGDLAVVRRRAKARLQICRRIVRIVGVEEVGPQEPRSACGRRLDTGHPLDGTRDDIVCATLDRGIAIFTRPLQPESCVVDVEAAIETGRRAAFRVENQRSDERAGPVAVVAQELRQVRNRRGQRCAEIVHAVARRKRARQQRRVRHRRHGRLRERAGEDDAVARQQVEVRRQPARRTEKAHAVRARRVERDQQDVRLA